MWPKRRGTAARLEAALADFSANERHLPGIDNARARRTLAMQMVASLRRLEYTERIRHRNISPERTNPQSPLFDPERAAILYARAGQLDEAFWLVFLATHFGKHPKHGWRRLRDVYSGLGSGIWTWERTSADPVAFQSWLQKNGHRIGGAFGNHRKYASLRTDSNQGTDKVLRSYIDWVGPSRSHATLAQQLIRAAGNDPHVIFDNFYNSMNVKQFGRLGK